MTGPEVLDVARDALTTLLSVAGPIMAIALGTGLIIALFQAMTQLQEMTLTFVPKIIAVFLGLTLLLPRMGQLLGSFMDRIADKIVTGGG
ncbi:flagellar biosynthesis protein FliQ [Yunchengibacter salinarum]|uniref:flagellar biosynthesis protein FliQ n=1 Tax=Yunchengibacter salinarum TaxID=3133399 RepID=UPI0035B63D91